MLGHLIGGIRLLWSSATAWARDPRRWIGATNVVDQHEQARTRVNSTQNASNNVFRPPFAPQNLLPWAMRSVDVDPDEIRALRGAQMREMQLICMACPCRGRCRRDLATGDFTRRYRHYCPNAAGLTEMASACHGSGRASVR